MPMPVIMVLLYVLVMPIVFRLIPFVYKKMVIEKKMEKAGNNRQLQQNIPKPLWPVWNKRIKYTMKDKRNVQIGKPKKGAEPKTIGVQRRQLFFVLWVLGLIIVVVGSLSMNIKLILPGFLMFFVTMMFGVKSSKAILKKHDEIYKKMFEIASARLNVSSEHAENPESVIKILEWSDPETPNKVQFDVPTTFNQSGEEAFMQQYNQVFGTENAWVPFDDPETKTPGWDYDKGLLTVKSVPPLPLMAPWDEHYITAPEVAWSYFPIALGTENGIELKNPKTGEIENVLGFDLSGEQVSHGKKAGIKVGPEITTSPMCLVGNTKILTSEGLKTIKEISETVEKVFVKSLNSNFDFVWSEIVETKVTRSNGHILKIVFEDGSFVNCTDDHEWMLSYGGYVAAKDLLNLYVKGFGVDGLKVVGIEDAGFEDVYDGEVLKTHNFVVIPENNFDGKSDENLVEEKYGNTQKGVVSSNCFVGGGTGGGKSLATNTLVQVIEKQDK